MKRKAFIFLFLLGFLLGANGQETGGRNHEKPKRKKVALVLSGGGAKGTAHIGALKVLERAGIPIDIICGTSMGSLIGGIYACGHPASEIDSVVKSLDWSFVLSDRDELKKQSLHDREKQNTYVISKEYRLGGKEKRNKEGRGQGGGFIMGKNVSALIDAFTAPYHDSIDFNTLPIPFACVATDVVDYSEQVFHSGILSRAMRASMSIPGVFAPVRMGERVLVDGGLTNNFPADVARAMGADYIIGVDVQEPLRKASDLTSTSSILLQIVDHNCQNKYQENLRLTDIHIHVNTKGYSSASFSTAAVDTMIRRGEEATMAFWDQLMALRRELNVEGGLQRHTLKGRMGNVESGMVKVEADTTDVSSPMVHVGARFDSEEMVALQVNAEWPIRTKVPAEMEVTLRLGKRLMGQVLWALRPLSYFRPTLSYRFRNNEMDFFEYGNKLYSITYNQHTGALKLFNFNVRNFNISIGANWDYYDFHTVLSDHHSIRDSEQETEDIVDKGFVNYKFQADYNSENDWYFPTRGAKIHARFIYHTDNFIELNNEIGMREYAAMWRMAFPISRKITIQPMLFGRLLFYDNETPFILSNMMGGEWQGHYVAQQMPFAGVGYVELAWEKLLAAQLMAQYKPSSNSIFQFRIAAGQDAPVFKDLLRHKTMLGASASYYLNTMFGPLGASIGYSNLTKKFYYFINLGFVF
jgi:NTE family protein